MPRKLPKFEYTLVCDDIREEQSNKLSIIGMYNETIFVSKLPYTFPKLCFLFSYKDIRAGDKFEIILKNPSGKTLSKKINGTVPVEIKGYVRFRLLAIFSPLKIETQGDYKIVIIINEKKSVESLVSIKCPEEK
jgi:uncharacterized protein DUF6941